MPFLGSEQQEKHEKIREIFVCAGLFVDKITAESALKTSLANKITEKRTIQKYSVVMRLGQWRSFQHAEVG